MYPNSAYEAKYNFEVIGVDEAGRGPLAGPVVAAAVVYNDKLMDFGIQDSKKLSKKKREDIFKKLKEDAVFSVGIADVHEIDELNILQATFLAMRRAFTPLPKLPVLVDGNQSPCKESKIETVVKGDAKSITIAAASIVAKCTRDEIMEELAAIYPQYGWEKNSGYGTKLHVDAIKEFGGTDHHRKKFLDTVLSKV